MDGLKLLAPQEAVMERHEPWDVRATSVYSNEHAASSAQSFEAPLHDPNDPNWPATRERTLREWGVRREASLHRRPVWLTDQLVSGSGLFPPRLLGRGWLSADEEAMLRRVEALVAGPAGTDTSSVLLARDLLAARLYNLDVRIVLDNSGSMSLDLFGEECTARAAPTIPWIEQHARTLTIPSGDPGVCGGCGPCCLCEEEPRPYKVDDVDEGFALLFRESTPAQTRLFGASRLCPCFARAPAYEPGARGGDCPDPRSRRWLIARQHMEAWLGVYRAMGLEPPVYVLNAEEGAPNRFDGVDVRQLFSRKPAGSTPLPEVIAQALRDHAREAAGRGLFLLVMTDGEANSMPKLNSLLDAIQNGAYGDVQVCLSGLSLLEEDLEWFENEECEGTRVRTVEPYEVEKQQMLRREVIGAEGEYPFSMHLYRVLLTNLFPADYDYEAPRQNLRHRLYITLHGKDRWATQRCACCGTHADILPDARTGGLDEWFGCCGKPVGPYSCASSVGGWLCCAPLFLASCCCGCGYMQGYECGECRGPEPLDCVRSEQYWRACCGLPLCCAYTHATTRAEAAQQARAEADRPAR